MAANAKHVYAMKSPINRANSTDLIVCQPYWEEALVLPSLYHLSWKISCPPFRHSPSPALKVPTDQMKERWFLLKSSKFVKEEKRKGQSQ